MLGEPIFHLHLHLGHLADAFIQSDFQQVDLSEEGELSRYSKDVHKTKCQAPAIFRLTHTPYTTGFT